MSEQNYDRWHPLHYTTHGFPEEVDNAFATILQHLEDRIKGFEIGQLVKFHPNASHHEEDGNYPWGIEHVIGRVTRRNQNTVSVIEISRRRYNTEVENTSYSGRRWRMLPASDDIIDE